MPGPVPGLIKRQTCLLNNRRDGNYIEVASIHLIGTLWSCMVPG